MQVAIKFIMHLLIQLLIKLQKKEESLVETESSKEEIEKDNKETVKEEKIQTVKQKDKMSYKQANMNVVNVLCYHPYYGYVIVPYVYKMQ